MSYRRKGPRSGKKDAIHNDVVRRLRMFPGIWVFETHNVGGGFPDLVVGWRREQTVVLVELKDKDARDRLTKNEERFHRDYPGDNLIVASGVREILDALGYPDF